MTETTIATLEDMLGHEIKVTTSPEHGVQLYIASVEGHAILGEVGVLELAAALITASIKMKMNGWHKSDTAENSGG